MALYILIGIIIGIITEIIAYVLKLWFYRHPAFQVSNVTLVFGLLCGLLTYHAAESGNLSYAIIAMGVFGLFYELANLHVFHLWRFPAKTMPWLKGHLAVLVTSAAWAGIPVMIYGLARQLQ